MSEYPLSEQAHEIHEEETTSFDGKTYKNKELQTVAETLPIHEISVEQLAPLVGPGQIYWQDRNGNALAPHILLKDWDAAKQTPEWKDHVSSIERANLKNPIWIAPDGHILDGVHRLCHAILTQTPTIQVRYFTELPSE